MLLFGGEVKVSIKVQPQEGLAVDQVRAFLNFNPSAMEVVAITPGSTFTNVTANTFDKDFGEIDFVASGNPTSGDFVLAEITFKTKDAGVAELATSVDFNVAAGSRETDAIFEGESVLGDTAAAGLTILKPQVDIRLDEQVVVGELVNGKLLGEVRDFSDNLIPDYRGLASGEVVQITVSVRQDTNQRVEALDVFLDFNPADLELLSLAPPDNAKLPVVLRNEKDNVKGTAVFSAQVGAGSPPASAACL